jgi:hypothetical protein
MDLVYLSNGQACYLKEEIGGKFIVNKIYEYEGEETGLLETVDETDIVVNEIFRVQPTEKINADIKGLLSQKELVEKDIKDLTGKRQQLKYDIENIRRTQISNEKFIIDRSELLKAKTIALFPEKDVMPLRMFDDKNDFRGLRLHLEIDIENGKEFAWGYKIYNHCESYSYYLCKKYGILINPTEEEIEETIRKRLAEFKFEDYEIARTADKYLTPELLTVKNNYLSNQKSIEVKELKKRLLDTQTELEKLK